MAGMNTQVMWLVQDQVLYIGYFGHITLDHIKEAEVKACELLDEAEGQHSIPLLVQTTRISIHPGSLLQIQSVTKNLYTHARFGELVLVADNITQRYFAKVLSRGFSKPLRTFAKTEEAAQYLYDNVTPPLPPIDDWNFNVDDTRPSR